jgi:hypothetical protein
MARQGRQIAFLSVCIAVAIFASYTAVIITAPSRITTWLQICSATTSAHSGLDFLAGWISAIIVTYTIKWYTRHLYDSSSNKGLYGLDHAILNIEIPPKNLWMNIGYWEVRQPV